MAGKQITLAIFFAAVNVRTTIGVWDGNVARLGIVEAVWSRAEASQPAAPVKAQGRPQVGSYQVGHSTSGSCRTQ